MPRIINILILLILFTLQIYEKKSLPIALKVRLVFKSEDTLLHPENVIHQFY